MKIGGVFEASVLLILLFEGGLRAQLCSRFAAPDFRPIESGEKAMQEGDRGDAVAAVQKTLQDMGFAIQQCDGKFGSETRNALMDYQAHLGFPQTGILDARTLAVLEMQAPANGEKLWQMDQPMMIPSPIVYVEGKQRIARVVVVKNERRTFLFSSIGKLLGVFPDAVGMDETPTDSGLREILGRLNREETAERGLQTRWKDSRVFGIHLLDLWEKDPVTGKVKDTPQELHGTYDASSIGTAASHGCIRHYNRDISRIYAAVKTGDLVIVQDIWQKNALAGQAAILASK